MSKAFLSEVNTNLGSSSSSNQSSMASSPVSRPIFRGLPKSPRPSFIHSRLSSKDNGGLPVKTRLVEQFYNSEPAQPQRSHGDLAAVFRNEVLGNQQSTGLDVFTEEALNDAIQKGKLSHQSVDREIADVHDIAETLINIDQTLSAKNLRIQNIEEVIEVVSRSARELERGLARSKLNLSGSSVQQLIHLSSYLEELQTLIRKVQNELASTTTQLEAQYREEMKASMGMLETLDQTLFVLNARLELARASMGRNKAVLGDTMGEKVAALEYISAKFAEYDQLNRYRKVQQLIVALVVVVTMVCGYMIVSHTLDVKAALVK